MFTTMRVVLAALLVSSNPIYATSDNIQQVLLPEPVVPETNITTYRGCWGVTREACRANYEDCGDALCSSFCLDNYPGLSSCCDGTRLRADQVRKCLIRHVSKPIEDDDEATRLATTSTIPSSSSTIYKVTSSSTSAADFKFVPPCVSVNSIKPNGETRLTAIGSGKLALAGIIVNAAIWMYLL